MHKHIAISAALLMIFTGTAPAQEAAEPAPAPSAAPDVEQAAASAAEPAAAGQDAEPTVAQNNEPAEDADAEPATDAVPQVAGGPRNLSGMSILGNQETPTSLVIVPWKSSEIGNGIGVSRALDPGIGPVDKDVFLRELQYYEIRTGGED